MTQDADKRRRYFELPRHDGEVCVGYWHDDGDRCWHYSPNPIDCINPNGKWYALRIGASPNDSSEAR